MEWREMSGPTNSTQVYITYNLYIVIHPPHLHIQLHTTTSDHHHTMQVAQVQVQVLRQWLDENAPPVQVAESDTTTCANALSVLVAEWRRTTSASCNWWQPSPVQVECLHQWKEGKPHKCKVSKVRMQGTKVKTHGAKFRARVSASWHRMQQQHASTATGATTIDQIWSTQHNATINATCVSARFVYREKGGPSWACPNTNWTYILSQGDPVTFSVNDDITTSSKYICTHIHIFILCIDIPYCLLHSETISKRTQFCQCCI